MAGTIFALSGFILSLPLGAKMPFFVGNFVSSIPEVVLGAFLLPPPAALEPFCLHFTGTDIFIKQ